MWKIQIMKQGSVIVERRIAATLTDLAAEESVIALHGPQSAGKSTVLSAFADSQDVEVIDLDDVETREAMMGNLRSVSAGQTPLCIDEYQRVPEIWTRLRPDSTKKAAAPAWPLSPVPLVKTHCR